MASIFCGCLGDRKSRLTHAHSASTLSFPSTVKTEEEKHADAGAYNIEPFGSISLDELLQQSKTTSSNLSTLQHQGASTEDQSVLPQQYNPNSVQQAIQPHLPSFFTDNKAAENILSQIPLGAWIGQGAFGAVYKGSWKGAMVAVKFTLTDPMKMDESWNELIISKALSHPRVVQVFTTATLTVREDMLQPPPPPTRNPHRSETYFSMVSSEFIPQPIPPSAQHNNAVQVPRRDTFNLSEVAIMNASKDASVHRHTNHFDPLSGCYVREPSISRGVRRDPSNVSDTALMNSLREPTAVSSSCTAQQGAAPPLGVLRTLQGEGNTSFNDRRTPTSDSRHTMNTNESSTFISYDGFGAPFLYSRPQFQLHDVLLRLKAQQGSTLTVLVMEYCAHGSLRKAIERRLFSPNGSFEDRITQRALLRTAREIAQGMQYLHESNIIHTDLKPENVLLQGSREDRRGFTAKVCDFGLSRVCINSDVNCSAWSTIAYMAPETFSGTVGKPSDVYAFGVLVHEMYVGKRPYTGLHLGEVIYGVQAGHLQPQWPENAPVKLVELSMACMHYDRQRRPTFNEIIDELAAIEDAVRRRSITNRVSMDSGQPRPAAAGASRQQDVLV